MKLAAAGLLALLLAVGCTSTPAVQDDADESASALTALAADEILGDIAYGETVGPVAYTENPRYRAYRFQGHHGDKVHAVVSGTGIPAAWILGANFATLTRGRGDFASHAVTLTETLAASGTFYIAFREATQEDATFSVALTLEPRDDGGGTSPGITVLDEEYSAGDCAARPLLSPARLARLKELATNGEVILGFPSKVDLSRDNRAKGGAAVKLRFGTEPTDYDVDIWEGITNSGRPYGFITSIGGSSTCNEWGWAGSGEPATTCWSDRHTASSRYGIVRDGCVAFRYANPNRASDSDAHFGIGLRYDFE